MEVPDEIAAQMGFSSFGNTTRKRKFNPKTDAFSGDPPPKPARAAPAAGTGGNRMPLGTRRQDRVVSVAVGIGGDVVASDGKGEGTGLDNKEERQQQQEQQQQHIGDPGYIDDTPPGSPPEQSKRESGKVDGQFTARQQDAVPQWLPQGPVSLSQVDGRQVVPLAAYAKGVRNERGDMVYFQPGFIEDPWAKLLS